MTTYVIPQIDELPFEMARDSITLVPQHGVVARGVPPAYLENLPLRVTNVHQVPQFLGKSFLPVVQIEDPLRVFINSPNSVRSLRRVVPPLVPFKISIATNSHPYPLGYIRAWQTGNPPPPQVRPS